MQTILIVDDDKVSLRLLKSYLEKYQYDVRVAHDGASFMSEFERYKDELSLVILDVMLPDTDGFTLCQTVRRQSQLPIIMLTASSDDTDRIVAWSWAQTTTLPSPTTRASCWRASKPCTGACSLADRPTRRGICVFPASPWIWWSGY